MTRITIIVLAVLISIPATAEVLTVPSDSFPTIAAAIAASAPGDEIAIEPGVYQEGDIECHHGITIRSSLAGEPVTIDAQGFEVGLFLYTRDADTTISDLVIMNAGAGLLINGDSPTFETLVSNCQFIENTSSGVGGQWGNAHFESCRMGSNGGSGWNWQYGSISMIDCLLDNNGFSGAYTVGVSLDWENVVIENNVGEDGGGMMLIASAGNFRNLRIENNTALDAGGGVCLSSDGTYFFDECTIADCSANRGSQGFFEGVFGYTIDATFNCSEVDTTQFAGEDWDAGRILITNEGCSVPVQSRSWSSIKSDFR